MPQYATSTVRAGNRTLWEALATRPPRVCRQRCWGVEGRVKAGLASSIEYQNPVRSIRPWAILLPDLERSRSSKSSLQRMSSTQLQLAWPILSFLLARSDIWTSNDSSSKYRFLFLRGGQPVTVRRRGLCDKSQTRCYLCLFPDPKKNQEYAMRYGRPTFQRRNHGPINLASINVSSKLNRPLSREDA